MELFGRVTHIDFMGRWRPAVALSVVLIVISLVSLAMRGLNLAVDFTGGTLIELEFSQPVELADASRYLADAGFPAASVQHFGNTREILVRIRPRPNLEKDEVGDQVVESLSRFVQGKLDVRRVEFVGPQVGKELTEQGGLAMLTALGAILVYVGLRFEWRFAAGAVAALVHDAVITIGIFSVLGLEFDLSVVAAVLALVGYSLNDTIVVYDRIRENFRKLRKESTMAVMNISINQTLSRTLMTGITTLLVLVSLLFLGGPTLWGFSFALTIGLFVGTYSSIYIASTAAMALGVSRADLLPPPKEDKADPGP